MKNLVPLYENKRIFVIAQEKSSVHSIMDWFVQHPLTISCQELFISKVVGVGILQPWPCSPLLIAAMASKTTWPFTILPSNTHSCILPKATPLHIPTLLTKQINPRLKFLKPFLFWMYKPSLRTQTTLALSEIHSTNICVLTGTRGLGGSNAACVWHHSDARPYISTSSSTCNTRGTSLYIIMKQRQRVCCWRVCSCLEFAS